MSDHEQSVKPAMPRRSRFRRLGRIFSLIVFCLVILFTLGPIVEEKLVGSTYLRGTGKLAAFVGAILASNVTGHITTDEFPVDVTINLDTRGGPLTIQRRLTCLHGYDPRAEIVGFLAREWFLKPRQVVEPDPTEGYIYVRLPNLCERIRWNPRVRDGATFARVAWLNDPSSPTYIEGYSDPVSDFRAADPRILVRSINIRFDRVTKRQEKLRFHRVTPRDQSNKPRFSPLYLGLNAFVIPREVWSTVPWIAQQIPQSKEAGPVAEPLARRIVREFNQRYPEPTGFVRGPVPQELRHKAYIVPFRLNGDDIWTLDIERSGVGLFFQRQEYEYTSKQVVTIGGRTFPGDTKLIFDPGTGYLVGGFSAADARL